MNALRTTSLQWMSNANKNGTSAVAFVSISALKSSNKTSSSFGLPLLQLSNHNNNNNITADRGNNNSAPPKQHDDAKTCAPSILHDDDTYNEDDEESSDLEQLPPLRKQDSMADSVLLLADPSNNNNNNNKQQEHVDTDESLPLLFDNVTKLQDGIQQALDLLRPYATQDLVLALHTHHQKHQRNDAFAIQFQDVRVPLPNNNDDENNSSSTTLPKNNNDGGNNDKKKKKKKNKGAGNKQDSPQQTHGTWSFFQCPQTGIIYKSGLPWPCLSLSPLLQTKMTGYRPRQYQELMQLVRTIFGPFVLVQSDNDNEDSSTSSSFHGGDDTMSQTTSKQQYQVIFTTLRGARRAAALSALQHSSQTQQQQPLVIDRVYLSNENKNSLGNVINNIALVHNNNNELPRNDETRTTAMKKSKSQLPSWAQTTLDFYGITNVKITYQQYNNNNNNNNNNTSDNCTRRRQQSRREANNLSSENHIAFDKSSLLGSTLLCCIIKIRKQQGEQQQQQTLDDDDDLALAICGAPSCNKDDALESAIELMSLELDRQSRQPSRKITTASDTKVCGPCDSGGGKGKHPSPNTASASDTKVGSPGDARGGGEQKKRHVSHKMEQKSTIYERQSLPFWACGSFDSNTANNPVLYQLEFIQDTTEQQTFATNHNDTPMGILFPSDPVMSLRANVYSFETILPLLSPKGHHQNTRVRLYRPKITRSYNGQPWINTKEQLWSLEKLNQIIFEPLGSGKKHFGTAATKKEISKVSNQPNSLRTCLFVPLEKTTSSLQGEEEEEEPRIDWTLVQNIVHDKETSLVLERMDRQWCKIWFSGPIDFLCLSMCMGSLGILSSLLEFPEAVRTNYLALTVVNKIIFDNGLSLVLTPLVIILLSLSQCFLLLHLFIPTTKYSVPREELENKLLCTTWGDAREAAGRRQKRRFHYIVEENSNHPRSVNNSTHKALTSRSRILSQRDCKKLSQKKWKRCLDLHGFDMRTATFVKKYWKQFKIRIRYSHLELLQCHPLSRKSNNLLIPNHWHKQGGTPIRRYLIPELVSIRPIPRDFYVWLSQAPKFMPKLERIIFLEHWSEMMSTQLLEKVPQSLLSLQTKASKMANIPVSLLQDGLDCGRGYQKLEFLGDSVLAFFTAINLFARNTSKSMGSSFIQWDADDLSNFHSTACNNEALFGASLEAGLSLWIDNNHRRASWKSAYSKTTARANPKHVSSLQSVAINQILSSSPRNYTTTSDKTMSDIAEAILGALYLSDDPDALRVIGMLEMFNLPLPSLTDDDKSAARPWFCAPCTCITDGYAFDRDSNWQDILHQVESILTKHGDIHQVLEVNSQKLVTLFAVLGEDPQIAGMLWKHKFLFMCALFDATLASGSAENLSIPAMLRDSLALVGNYSLQLCVITELHRRYPDASEGDLNLQKACAIADDVLVYVMFKAGMDGLLFDQEAKSLMRFRAEMKRAEEIGRTRFWTKTRRRNSGHWILNGGVAEFQRRQRIKCHLPPGQEEKVPFPDEPRYCGVHGGRLCGRNKRLSSSMISDFVFSFKAIIGALVLSTGLEGMWACIAPLMEELLLLTADELRQILKDIKQAESKSTTKSKQGKEENKKNVETLSNNKIERQ